MKTIEIPVASIPFFGAVAFFAGTILQHYVDLGGSPIEQITYTAVLMAVVLWTRYRMQKGTND